MGRTARGVRGIRVPEGHLVVSLIIPQEGSLMLVASGNGYGKRTRIEEFPIYGRGGQGVIALQCSERNGNLVSAVQVFEGDEMMLITDKGTLVRSKTEEVSIVSRNTQGVRLIKLSQENEQLVGVERVDESVSDDVDEDALIDGEAVVDGDVLINDSVSGTESGETPVQNDTPSDVAGTDSTEEE